MFVVFSDKLDITRGGGMRDELLAYLLNDLDDQQRQRVEERLEVDPIWQHELERLRSYVDASRGQDDDSEPLPEDLVHRTCSFVRQASSQGELSPAVLPAKLSESRDATQSRGNHWTMVDWVVVASILTIMGTLLVPAIQESREAARRVQCQAKLKELGHAFISFAEQHDGQLPAIGRNENAGMYAVRLLESGVITPEALSNALQCPSDETAETAIAGTVSLVVPTRDEMRRATRAQIQWMVKRMGGSFAYRIGYIDRQGNYRQIKFTRSSSEPMLADKPSYEVAGFQSPHHGPCGQNVLFQDGSVSFVQICIQTGPDKHWFLNEDKKHAAGMHRADIVMGRSEASPSGTIELINNKQQPVILPQR